MAVFSLLLVSSILQFKLPYEPLPLPTNSMSYASRLKGKGYAFVEEGEVLTIVRKQKAEHMRITGPLSLSMQASGVPDVWLARVKIKGLPRAVISVIYQPVDKQNKPSQASYAIFRGSKSPAAIEPVKKLKGSFKTVKLPLNAKGRSVSVYTPPGFTQGGPAIFMSNGQMTEQFAQVLEALILKKSVRPVALVGFHRAEGGTGTEEYSASDEFTYRRHMKWVLETVVPYAQGTVGVSKKRSDLTIFGFSSGAEFAGAAALQNPGLFSRAWLYSVPMSNPNRFVSVRKNSGVHFQLCAGSLETVLGSTQAYAKSLDGVGKVNMSVYVGGHDLAPWLVEFERMVRKAYAL